MSEQKRIRDKFNATQGDSAEHQGNLGKVLRKIIYHS